MQEVSKNTDFEWKLLLNISKQLLTILYIFRTHFEHLFYEAIGYCYYG